MEMTDLNLAPSKLSFMLFCRAVSLALESPWSSSNVGFDFKGNIGAESTVCLAFVLISICVFGFALRACIKASPLSFKSFFFSAFRGGVVGRSFVSSASLWTGFGRFAFRRFFRSEFCIYGSSDLELSIWAMSFSTLISIDSSWLWLLGRLRFFDTCWVASRIGAALTAQPATSKGGISSRRVFLVEKCWRV